MSDPLLSPAIAADHRYLIVNAEDLGASPGINRGIIECHNRGVVTSASLMVTGRAVDEAVRLAHGNPSLAIGLHFDVWGEDERTFNTRDLNATRNELRRQVDRFELLMGRMPTHLDSHRHVHRAKHLFPFFREWVKPLHIPLRDACAVRYVGGFYAQWEWMVTEPKYISVEFLQQMLCRDVPSGFTEIACHPGYVSADFRPAYGVEREAEIATLTDPRVRRTIEEEGIRLISYADYPAVT